jgi:hypothetical protein
MIAAGPIGQRGQQHQHEHHDEVLDHQPADGNTTVDGLQRAARLESAQ